MTRENWTIEVTPLEDGFLVTESWTEEESSPAGPKTKWIKRKFGYSDWNAASAGIRQLVTPPTTGAIRAAE